MFVDVRPPSCHIRIVAAKELVQPSCYYYAALLAAAQRIGAVAAPELLCSFSCH